MRLRAIRAASGEDAGIGAGRVAPAPARSSGFANLLPPAPSITGVTATPAGAVGQFTKLELTVAMTNAAGTYDPDPAHAAGVDLSGTFIGSAGGSAPQVIPGFFDGTAWKIRFAPDQPGAWTYRIDVTTAGGSAAFTTGSFACTISSGHGWLRASGTRLVFNDGTGFIGNGHNSGWQTDAETPPLAQMAAGVENLLSFWLVQPWASTDPASGGNYNPTRAPIENAFHGLGNYEQPSCQYIDGVVQRAEAAGVYLLPSIWAHDQLHTPTTPVADGWPSSWDNNPYQTICAPAAFFTLTSGSVDTPQWTYQKNFYRYLIARWGYSTAIAGWVAVVEAEGTTAGAASMSQASTWSAAVNSWFAAIDPFRGPASTYPMGISRSDGSASALTWTTGCGLRAYDSYQSKNSDTAIGATIATQTRTMRGGGAPVLHSEFGGDVSGGANQPAHLHAGLWAGLAAGSAMTPLLWTDGGSYPLLTDATSGAAMRDEYARLAQFGATIPWAAGPGVAESALTISGGATYAAWGMQLGDRGWAWIQNSAGTISPQTLTAAGCSPGTYRVAWHDPWSASGIPMAVVAPVVVGGGGILSVGVPAHARRDIACRFWRNAAPTASAQAVAIAGATAITLAGADADGDALAFVIATPPAHGTLTGTPPSVTYVPGSDYAGSDVFTFTTGDGLASSAPATVTLSTAAAATSGSGGTAPGIGGGGGGGGGCGLGGLFGLVTVLALFASRRGTGPRPRS